jgi:hypothetical protein
MIDKEKLIKLLKGFSVIQPYRSPDFTKPEATFFWFKELQNFNYEKLKEGLENHIRNHDHFPSLREVLLFLGEKGAADVDTTSKICALQIYNAICRIGYANWEDAQKMIGSLGMVVVHQYGGWKNLCEYITHENQSYVVHHLGEIAKAILLDPNHGNTIALPAGESALALALSAPRNVAEKKLRLPAGKKKDDSKDKGIADPKGDNPLA